MSEGTGEGVSEERKEKGKVIEKKKTGQTSQTNSTRQEEIITTARMKGAAYKMLMLLLRKVMSPVADACRLGLLPSSDRRPQKIKTIEEKQPVLRLDVYMSTS